METRDILLAKAEKYDAVADVHESYGASADNVSTLRKLAVNARTQAANLPEQEPVNCGACPTGTRFQDEHDCNYPDCVRPQASAPAEQPSQDLDELVARAQNREHEITGQPRSTPWPLPNMHNELCDAITDLRAQLNDIEMWKVKQHNAQASNSKIMDAFHQRNEQQAATITRLESSLFLAEAANKNAALHAEQLEAEKREMMELLERLKDWHIRDTAEKSSYWAGLIEELLKRTKS